VTRVEPHSSGAPLVLHIISDSFPVPPDELIVEFPDPGGTTIEYEPGSFGVSWNQRRPVGRFETVTAAPFSVLIHRDNDDDSEVFELRESFDFSVSAMRRRELAAGVVSGLVLLLGAGLIAWSCLQRGRPNAV